MPTKIAKCTEKGQITLPKQWRDLFDTDSFVVDFDDKQLVIKPFHLSQAREDIIFDADRDNEGNGMPIEEMIEILKKSRNG
jgi:AbrB family looped-hinge helix DNA binding protein